jgi:hypothetical protein
MAQLRNRVVRQVIVVTWMIGLASLVPTGWAGADPGASGIGVSRHPLHTAALTASTVRSRAGDRDNFGYGIGSGPPPCVFFDNREHRDLHVFDYEQPGQQTRVWTHTFAITGTPTLVKLKVWEIFSDGREATIDLDGHTFPLVRHNPSGCGYEGGAKRVFTLAGSDALIAADGAVTVTFMENGDDIALDRSRLLVTVD